MTSTEDTASSGRRWRRVAGTVLGLLLVAGAIALGVSFSNKSGGGTATAPAAAGQQEVDASADAGNVAKVLDALNNMGGGGDATVVPSLPADPVPIVGTPEENSKDGSGLVFSGDLTNMAGSAQNTTAPGPQGLIQAMSAAAYNSLGMRVCTPNNGAELVGAFECGD